MRSFASRLCNPRLWIVLVAVMVSTVSVAQAVELTYSAILSGPAESPPNASPGIGIAQVDINTTTNMMHVYASFSGLVSTTTNCHIHAATAVAGTGTAGVATTTPTFAGFPSGVTSGTYDNTLDMTLASSYNPAYVTANGGTPATARAALFQAMADGKAYFNIHSNTFPGGEIRGFLSDITVPVSSSTWGRVKKLYR